jgi:hypothetical protein
MNSLNDDLDSNFLGIETFITAAIFYISINLFSSIIYYEFFNGDPELIAKIAL